MSGVCPFDDATPGDGADIADLVVLSYDGLLHGGGSEASSLLAACSEWGFFYLDLRFGTQEVLTTVEQLFGVAREYFAKPLEEKLKDTHDDQDIFPICGYKPMGLDNGNVENQKDGCEGLRLPYDLLIPTRDARVALPQGVEQHWPAIASFMGRSRSICVSLLESLSASMGLEEETDRLEHHHRADAPSTTTAVLQCYPVRDLPPNTSQGHFTHTDAGSISMLFTTEWGLQVHSPRTGRWAYVAPRPGCAVVNVGDSLRFLAGCRLKSSLHRVVPCRERWLADPRYSVIFFLRPSNDAIFTDSEGVTWAGSEWLGSKFRNYRNPHRQQQESAMSTGKKGYLGLWEDPPAPAKRPVNEAVYFESQVP